LFYNGFFQLYAWKGEFFSIFAARKYGNVHRKRVVILGGEIFFGLGMVKKEEIERA